MCSTFNLTGDMQQAIARLHPLEVQHTFHSNVHLDANVFSWFAQPLDSAQEQKVAR